MLPSDSEEYEMLKEYVANTHGATHSQYSLDLLDVFKVDREGEGKKYKPFSKLHNRQLLWHGSRKTNFVGILSQVCFLFISVPMLTVVPPPRACGLLHLKPQ